MAASERERQLAASFTPEQRKEAGRLIKLGRNPSEVIHSLADQADVYEREQPTTTENAAAGALGFVDSFAPNPSIGTTIPLAIAAPATLPMQGALHLIREATGANQGLEDAQEAAPGAFGVGGGIGALGSLIGVGGAARAAGAFKGAPKAASGAAVGDAAGPILERMKDAGQGIAGKVDDWRNANPVGEKIARIVGGDRVGHALDLAKKARAPVAGPAGDVKPTTPLPPPTLEPSPYQAAVQQAIQQQHRQPPMGPAPSENTLNLQLDQQQTRPAITAALSGMKEKMGADAAAIAKHDQGRPLDMAAADALRAQVSKSGPSWSMSGDEVKASGGDLGVPFVEQTPWSNPNALIEQFGAAPSPVRTGTESGRAPVRITDDMVLESVPVASQVPELDAPPPLPSDAADATRAVGGDKTAQMPRPELRALKEQAMLNPPKIDAPPALPQDLGMPADPQTALAFQARAMGIDQRFSKGAAREAEQLKGVEPGRRQAFFDVLAKMHGQAQTRGLAKAFNLTMPPDAPKYSTSGSRVASMEGAHKNNAQAMAAGREQNPLMLEAVEAQRPAVVDPGPSWVGRDPARAEPVAKYTPKDEAERAELMGMDLERFDQRVKGEQAAPAREWKQWERNPPNTSPMDFKHTEWDRETPFSGPEYDFGGVDLFHGSPVKGLSSLVPDKGKGTKGEFGIFMTPKKGYAQGYGDNLYPVETSARRPLIVSAKHEISPRNLTKEDAQRLADLGYDSIVSSKDGTLKSATEVVVFDPSLVKMRQK